MACPGNERQQNSLSKRELALIALGWVVNLGN